MRNEHEFRTIAMKRSGHHAIMLWLAGHFDAPVHHLNDIRPFSDPFTSSNGRSHFNELLGKDDQTIANVTQSRLAPKVCLLLSYEDLDLSSLNGRSLVQDDDQWLGQSRHRTHVLCLRDPYNMLASRYALWPEEVREKHGTILSCWCGHASEYLGRTTALDAKIVVNFNDWFVNRSYRQDLSLRLALNFTDRGFRVIPPSLIGGSSFQRLALPGRPEDLDVLSRWRSFEHDSEFWSFFDQTTGVHALSEVIFGRVLATGPAPL